METPTPTIKYNKYTWTENSMEITPTAKQSPHPLKYNNPDISLLTIPSDFKSHKMTPTKKDKDSTSEEYSKSTIEI